mgnify:CR=1 FL=1
MIISMQQRIKLLIIVLKEKWFKDFHLASRKKTVIDFKNSTNISDKRLILNTYNPNYILIDHSKNELDNSYMNWIEQVGKSVYQKENIQLFKVIK